MLYFDGVFGLAMLGLWLFCLFDVITTDSVLCRNLPKLAWLFIVLLLPDIGSIAWLVAGHPWQATPGRDVRPGIAGRYPEYDRPGRQAATNPDDDEAFLRGLRERAEQQRRDYRAKREQQLAAERDQQERERQRWQGKEPGQDGSTGPEPSAPSH